MKVIDDGVIKYDRSNFSLSAPINLVEYSLLEYWRKILYNKNLIGEYPEVNIGFGNLSEIKDYSHYHQTKVPQFIITGTQTGKFAELSGDHYTRVLDYNIDMLQIKMMGPVEASSEALTHACIYQHNSNIKAIFHIHSPLIWKGMIKENYSSTAASISYGTVEMARATEACVGNNNFGEICMKGHEDGVIAYGRTLEEAGNIILKLYEKFIGLK